MNVAVFCLLCLLALTMLATVGTRAYGDPLQGSTKQRIGNYELEIATQPRVLVAGNTPATVMVRFAGVNGDDLVDVPVALRIVKGGVELYKTNPIVVPYGHHNFEFVFAEPGRYALYIDLNDYAYSGQVLTFAFPLTVAGPLDQISLFLPVVGGVTAAGIGAAVVFKMKKKSQLQEGTD